MKIPADWTFRNASVAEEFDRHVREQLPWYDLVAGATAHFARHYLPENGIVYDVGASTGNMGKLLADCVKVRNARMIAIESSPEMAAKYAGPGELVVADAVTFAFEPFDVAICFLVMMFFPPAARKAWLTNLVSKCRPGGAVVVVDKEESAGGYFGTAVSRLTLAGKLATGTSPSDIIAKELSLPGAQRPFPKSWFGYFGPGTANEFFRFGEFVGFVIDPGNNW